MITERKSLSTFVVDYDRSLNDSIAAGHYDWVNEKITEENFPVEADEQGKKEKTFTLYQVGVDVDFDIVISRMEAEGKRPASVRELLAFGEANPELQRIFPIIALKSIWACKSMWAGRDGHRSVAYLDGGAVRRGLDLGDYDSGWLEDCRFLVVDK